MKYYFFKILSIFGFCLVFTTQNVNAQSSSASPYSRYAFGDIAANPHSSYYGLGGISLSLCDSFQFNSFNPASYSFLMKHRPIFDIGVGGQNVIMNGSSSTAKATTFGLKAISMGLPVSDRWGISFGITPLSSVGYSFSTHEEHPVIGGITHKFDGNGGINRLYAGTSFLIVDNSQHKFSVGMNLTYLFGSLLTSNRTLIDDQSIQTGFLHSKTTQNTFISDFILEGGFLYRGKLNNTSYLNFGGNLNASSPLYAKREFLSHSFNDPITESLVDTVEYRSSEWGRIYFPKKIGFAVSYEKRFSHKSNQNAFRRLIISAQYDLQDWANYSEVFKYENDITDSIADGMRNSRAYSFAIQYNPFSSSIIGPNEKWWNISTYRLSFSSASTYLQINDTQLKQYGIGFGIGIPLINSLSFSLLNVGVEAGKRGSLDSGLIEESFINLSLGLTISPHRNDPWFIKRKYD
jgi:uncharacterized protein YaiE (UPF0345 family)